MNLCTDPILKDLLEKRGITVEVFDAILSKSEKQEMLENLEVFASNWFIENGEDISEYRNVSIGAAIHDDVLTFFSSLYHILLLVEKLDYKKNKIVFYQSKSCELPESVKKALLELGVNVETTMDKYPFPCYKRAFEKNAYSRITYTGIVYDGYSKTKHISSVRPGVRSFIYKIIFNIIDIIYIRPKKIFYLRPMRRLLPMFYNFINNDHKDADIQLKVAYPESNIGEQFINLISYNVIRTVKKLARLTKKGIFFKRSIWMLAPRNGILNNYYSEDEKERQIQLIENSKGSIENLIGFNNIDVYNLFFCEFLKFYSHHFNKFIGLINKLHLDVKKNNVNNYLVEFINPFLAQVLANYNRNIFFIHLSRWINNQYFCKQFIDNVNGRFFILVSSEFESDRIIKQSFDKTTLIKVCESYFDNKNVKKINSYEISDNEFFLYGKSVLVIAPPLAVIWTYRCLLDSTFFINFISDIISALELFNLSKIIIRPTLGKGKINRMNFTQDDLNSYMFKDIVKENCSYIIRDNNHLVNIEKDLNEADLVIGTPSACAIDAALVGLDYIAYDNSIYPFPDSLNLSIFSKNGPVPIASNRDELINNLNNYTPNYGRDIINFIKPHNKIDNSLLLNKFNLSELYKTV